MIHVLLDGDVGSWAVRSREDVTWGGSTAVGLKPPSRGRMVATDRLTAVEVGMRRRASGPPPLGGEAEVDVEALLDQVDHNGVHVDEGDASWPALMSM